jgi:opacity protein-like surface antigen
MKKTFRQVVACGILVAVSGLTSTAMATIALPTGWYVEGNAGVTREYSVSYGPGVSNSSNGFSWNANMGYKFMPFFATEAGFTRYADGVGKYMGVKVADDSHYSLDITGKLILPVAETGLALFGKLGVAWLHSDVNLQNSGGGTSVRTGSRTGTGFYLGAGAEYSWLPNLAFNLQWQRAKGNQSTGTLDLYSGGVSYLF